MKVKVHYEKRTFHSAEVEIDEDDFLEYINESGGEVLEGSEFESLDEVRADEGEDFDYLLQEYLGEKVFKPDALLVGIPTSPAGPSEFEIDTVVEL